MHFFAVFCAAAVILRLAVVHEKDRLSVFRDQSGVLCSQKPRRSTYIAYWVFMYATILPLQVSLKIFRFWRSMRYGKKKITSISFAKRFPWNDYIYRRQKKTLYSLKFSTSSNIPHFSRSPCLSQLHAYIFARVYSNFTCLCRLRHRTARIIMRLVTLPCSPIFRSAFPRSRRFTSISTSSLSPRCICIPQPPSIYCTTCIVASF